MKKKSTATTNTTKDIADTNEHHATLFKPTLFKFDYELRRSERGKRRKERAQKRDASRRKRKSKTSSPHFETTTPNQGDQALVGREGDLWAKNDGEAGAKDVGLLSKKKPKGTTATVNSSLPHEKKLAGAKNTKKPETKNLHFGAQHEMVQPTKPRKPPRKTRTKKSKSTSPHFNVEVKDQAKGQEISTKNGTISKPQRTKSRVKKGEISGIKKAKKLKAESPLKTLIPSKLQVENTPQTRAREAKKSKRRGSGLEVKVENPPTTRKTKSRESKSAGPHHYSHSENTPEKIVISQIDHPPKAIIDSPKLAQTLSSKLRRTRSKSKTVSNLEQSEEKLEARGSGKKKERKQQFEDGVVVLSKQERKERKKTVRRVQAGISTAIWPPLSAERFGLIQEELKGDAFHLIVGTTFLNRTRGSVAIPLLRQFLCDYPTPYALSIAPIPTISAFLQPLGLYNIRAARLHNLAKAWLTAPPTFGHATKKYNYPPRDTKAFPSSLLPNKGVEQGRGWEIAHLPGVGAYALDSWRLFCRDEFRRAAGESVEVGHEEWRSVVPMDKELRVYVRWMWAKEGIRWKESGDVEQTALSSPFFDQ